MEKKIYKTELGGRTLEVEFSPLASQANASCLVKYGETVVLVTVVYGRQNKEGIDFVPLTVDYEEKFYAAGKIYGSRFIRRETRPTEGAILTARLIDRSLRPLFDQRLRREVQIVNTVLSIDEDNDPDWIALLGSSLAVCISGLPFAGPAAGVRLLKETPTSETILQPSYPQREKAYLEGFFAGTQDRINMLEIASQEAQEEEVVELSQLAHTKVKELIAWQEQIIKDFSVPAVEVIDTEVEAEVSALVDKFVNENLEQILFGTEARDKKLLLVQSRFQELVLSSDKPELLEKGQRLLDKKIDELVHRKILQENRRVDSRQLDELRPIEVLAGVLPRTHGSALFLRGETHALSVVTLGAPGEALFLQGMEITGEKRFIHHYNFPPYSTGETGSFRSTGRREIGHGALAEKAILPMVPTQEEFPYTIRVVTEILSSNGSTSMASTCGTSLALMDAGVPLKKHVAGIAMGLMTDSAGNYKILTDIQGPEDHYGDMDCKVAGTREGLTAIQMDVKIEGITPEMLKEILTQARQARLEILEKMYRLLTEPRKELSVYAPKIITTKVPVEKIGEIIGSGGKTIQGITRDTGAAVEIEDDGTVFISAPSKDKVEAALAIVQGIIKEPEAGEIYEGKVTKFFEFGALVSLTRNKEGLLHVSELNFLGAHYPDQILKIGQPLRVRVLEVTPEGKYRLTIKDLDNPELKPLPESSRQDFHRPTSFGRDSRPRRNFRR